MIYNMTITLFKYNLKTEKDIKEVNLTDFSDNIRKMYPWADFIVYKDDNVAKIWEKE